MYDQEWQLDVSQGSLNVVMCLKHACTPPGPHSTVPHDIILQVILHLKKKKNISNNKNWNNVIFQFYCFFLSQARDSWDWSLLKGSVERSRHERHFCSLLPYFLLSWLQIFQLCLSFWTSSSDLVLFKNSFRKKKNIWKTTPNGLAPSIFIVLSIALKLDTPCLHTQAQNTCYRIFNFALEVEIWTKKLQKRCFTHPVGFDEALVFSQVEIKKSVTIYFSPCIDEENKKNCNKIGAKLKTLEAKPFDQNAENWKRENRQFTSTVPEASALWQNRIGTHTLRSHRTVWFFFVSQTLVSC